MDLDLARLVWFPAEFILGGKFPSGTAEERIHVCARFGLHLVTSPKAWISGGSHLCLPQVRLTPQLMTGLAHAAPIVSLEYLDELLLVAQRRDDGLDQQFQLPDPLNYIPQLATRHLSSQAAKTQLASNTSRRNLFRGATALFIFATESPRPRLQSAIELFQSCAGKVELLSVKDAPFDSEREAQRALQKYKSTALSLVATLGEDAKNAPDGGLVVLVEDAPSVFQEPWYQSLARATRSMDVRMCDAGSSAVATAVLECDARVNLNSVASVNLYRAELQPYSEGQAGPYRPTSATVSMSAREASIPPPTADTSRSTKPPRDESPPLIPQNAAGTGSSQDTQKTLRLRRRALAVPSNALDQLFGEASQQEGSQGSRKSDEPRSAEDDRSRQQSDQEYGPLSGPGAKYPSASKRRLPPSRQRLSDVFGIASMTETGEVEPETPPDVEQPKSKRYRHLLQLEDIVKTIQLASSSAVEGAEANRYGRESSQPKRQRIASEDDNMASIGIHGSTKSRKAEFQGRSQVIPLSTSERRNGTGISGQREDDASFDRRSVVIRAVERPRGKGAGETSDVESDFLQALAMKKKGKRAAIDEFDVEFNNLRLTKPKVTEDGETHVDEEYTTWKATELDDFDLPVGNFVQVDFVPLMRKRQSINRHTAATSAHDQWEGRPNFKKFKNKEKPVRQVIAMDLAEVQDYGLGDAYLHKSRSRGCALPSDVDARRADLGLFPHQPPKPRTNNILEALRYSDSDEDQVVIGPRNAERIDAERATRRIRGCNEARLGQEHIGKRQTDSEDNNPSLPDLQLPQVIAEVDFRASRTARRDPAARGNDRGKGMAFMSEESEEEETSGVQDSLKSRETRAHSQAALAKCLWPERSQRDDLQSDSDGGLPDFKGTSKSVPDKRRALVARSRLPQKRSRMF